MLEVKAQAHRSALPTIQDKDTISCLMSNLLSTLSNPNQMAQQVLCYEAKSRRDESKRREKERWDCRVLMLAYKW